MPTIHLPPDVQYSDGVSWGMCVCTRVIRIKMICCQFVDNVVSSFIIYAVFVVVVTDAMIYRFMNLFKI